MYTRTNPNLQRSISKLGMFRIASVLDDSDGVLAWNIVMIPMQQGFITNDADCDAIATSDDCDDTDKDIGSRSNDLDCDGVLTNNDCDDNNENAFDVEFRLRTCAPTVSPSGSQTILVMVSIGSI